MSEQYAHHIEPLERNGSAPPLGGKHVAADTPGISFSSEYEELPSNPFHGNRYGPPNSWYSRDQQPLESSAAQQRPKVSPLQHHSYGSASSFAATPHASQDYAPIYEEPRTMPTPPRRPTYVAMHCDRDAPGAPYPTYAGHGFGSPGVNEERDFSSMPLPAHVNNGYARGSTQSSGRDNRTPYTPEYDPMYDEMDDHLQAQGQHRMAPPPLAQWATPPPAREGYVPIYLYRDGRPTFSGWRKIHPQIDPYSGNHH